MGLKDDIRSWFNAHPNWRVAFKQVTLGICGAALYLAGTYVAKLGPEWFGIATLALNALNDRYKLLSPFEPWPVVGASAPGAPVRAANGQFARKN